jgi:hypothetical protein
MMTAGKAMCIICSKEKCAVRCEGCLNTFGFDHFQDHRTVLNKQLDEFDGNRDRFRQTFVEQTADPQKHPLMEQVHRWERESIKKIQQTAEEAKQMLLKQINNRNARIEFKINTLTDQLSKTRQENDFNEIDLINFRKALSRLTNELGKPLNIFIREDSNKKTKLLEGIVLI